MKSPEASPRRFDAEAWNALVSGADAGGWAFVFRHGIECAAALQREVRRPGDLWLDVGCGPGELARAAAAAGSRVVALDADPRMLALARERLGSDAPTRFLAGRAECLPLPDESVDGVAAVSLVGCLAAAESFFQETARVLRPGGTALISFTNRRWLLRVLDRPAKGTEAGGRYRLFSVRESRERLRDAGLRVVGVRPYNFFVILGQRLVPQRTAALAWERLCRGSAFRALARNFIVMAVKDGSTPSRRTTSGPGTARPG